MELKTPLYESHLNAGGKIVPFAGYLLPVQYETGVIAEHMAVREKAGLFDVSHMGEVVFRGRDALKNLERIFTNSFSGMYDGQVRYSLMCNDTGGILDDLLVYRLDAEAYLVVVNASNRHKDVQWIKEHLDGEVGFEDISDKTAQIALQGPKSKEIISKLIGEQELPAKYYSFNKECALGGVSCLISRTGYTGEFGYEIYTSAEDAPQCWDMLLKAGAEQGLIPCGLGARDTLRLEASMPLYGHEMDETTDPLELGLDFAVKLNKDDFIGRAAIMEKGERKRCRTGLFVTGRGIIREDAEVFAGDRLVGKTTSGTFCPFLGRGAAMVILDKEYSAPGTAVEALVRGRRIEAEVTQLPFYTGGARG